MPRAPAAAGCARGPPRRRPSRRRALLRRAPSSAPAADGLSVGRMSCWMRSVWGGRHPAHCSMDARGPRQVFVNTGLGAFRQVLFNANAHLASTSAGRCVGRIGHHDRCFSTLVIVYSAHRRPRTLLRVRGSSDRWVKSPSSSSVLSGRAATSAPFVCALLIAVRAPGADRTLHMAVSALCLRRGTGAEHAARRLNEGEGPPERYAGCCRAPASPAATRTGRPPPRCCRSMLIIQKRLMHATRRQVQGMPRGAYARPRVIWARHRLLRCASRGHAARMRPAPPAAPASLERSENFFYSNRVCFLGPNPQRDPILSFLFSGDPILAIPQFMFVQLELPVS